ncbi:MAG: hypothetical protein II956_09890 [Bacteroidales bacterium]|nr:hypothetical protein [Bacteroidales bacterium]
MKRFFIILLLAFVFQNAFAQDVEDKYAPDIKWYVDNIKSDSYQIRTPAELVGFASLVNGTSGFSAYDFSDKTVELAADINLGCHIDTTGKLIGSKWTAIGKNYSTRFAGTFDGKGFCISGMIVKAEEDEVGALFGYSSGTIKNVTISGGYICADYYGASICSHNSGKIEYCINTANIISNNYGGGICGKNYEDGSITNCFNYGYVMPRNFCGGILGSNSPTRTVVANCVYDIQMCPIKTGCGTFDVKTIKGLTTNQILNADGYIVDGNIKLEKGMYPRLTMTEKTPLAIATFLPVVLPDNENVVTVSSPIKLAKYDGVTYTTSEPSILAINNNVCTPKERADVILFIKGNDCMRFIKMRIADNQLKPRGDEHSPLRINNYDDFLKFANAVNYDTDYKGYANINSFEGVTIVLTDNIRIPEGVNWKPIGSKVTPFKGTFIGYGFCISNLNIRYPLMKNCGLFGYNEGLIQKVVVVGGNIIGGDCTGAICGFNSKGKIQKCISSIAVRGHYYAGGICGYNNEGFLSQVINVNSVKGIDNFEGGICGGTSSGRLEYCVYDKQMCLLNNAIGEISDNPQLLEVNGLLTESMTGNALESKNGFGFDFQFEDDMYPRIVSVTQHPDSDVASMPVFMAKNENAQNITSFISMTERENIKYSCNRNDVLKITRDKALPLKQGSVIFSVTNGRVEKRIILKITSQALEQIGTRDNPLEISSYEDLKEFREAVNNNSDYKGFACIDGFDNVYFKISKNIQCPSNVNQMPVGNYLFPFKGVLDGAGHTVSGFLCDHKNADNMGFVGYNSGLICNLRLSRSPVTGRYYSGGICGFNTGEIFNCKHDSASVTGSNYTGGICGYSKGIISFSKNTGAVKGDYFVGGITGENTGRLDSCLNMNIITGISSIGGITGNCAGDIENCVNSGVVHGSDNTGGVSGRNSYATISQCSNSGGIEGGDCTGGITGLNEGTVIKCENTGMVSAILSTGGIVGKGGKIYFCINSAEIVSSGNNAGGIIGASKNNSELKYCINKGAVSASAFAGGICADNGGKIISCVNFGEIRSSYYVGGICGYNSNIISSCIFLNNVVGSSYTGAICGRHNSGTVANCFYNKDICSFGGINNVDIPEKAMGLNKNMMIGDALKDSLIKLDFIFSQDNYPMPKMQ